MKHKALGNKKFYQTLNMSLGFQDRVFFTSNIADSYGITYSDSFKGVKSTNIKSFVGMEKYGLLF